MNIREGFSRAARVVAVGYWLVATYVVWDAGARGWRAEYGQTYSVDVAFNNGEGVPLSRITSRTLSARAASLDELDTIVEEFCNLTLTRAADIREWDEFGNPIVRYVSAHPTAQCDNESQIVPAPVSDRARQAFDAAWPVLVNFAVAYFVLWIIFRALGWVALGFMEKRRE